MVQYFIMISESSRKPQYYVTVTDSAALQLEIQVLLNLDLTRDPSGSGLDPALGLEA